LEAGPDEKDATSSGDAACGGPIPATNPDTHCETPDGGRGDSVPPHEGTEADDDNCLYHLTMNVPCVRRYDGVAFAFELVDLGAMTPSTGANPYIEGSVGSHLLPNTSAKAVETNGSYTIEPIIFDLAGKWTITFHLYTATAAKHSHVSFFIDVP
jgi:hypothetical protein